MMHKLIIFKMYVVRTVSSLTEELMKLLICSPQCLEITQTTFVDQP